jgi:hypothetical protein
MSIQEVISALVADKKEAIMKEIEIITEGIVYLQLTQESLMASDTLSDAIVEDTFECLQNKVALESAKAKFEYIIRNISNTDEVLDIYTYYGISRNKWLESYKKGKA